MSDPNSGGYDPNALPPPPPQGYPQQPGYPPQYQQGYAPMVNPFESRGTTIMILGILGLVICQVLGIVAWVMGNNLKKEAEAAGYPEPGNSKAGRICGMIAVALVVVGVVIFGIVFILAAGTATVTVNN